MTIKYVARCILKTMFGVSKHARNTLHIAFNLKDITEILADQATIMLRQLLNSSSTSSYLLDLLTRTHKKRHFSSVDYAVDTHESRSELLGALLMKNQKSRRSRDPQPDQNSSRVIFLIENWYSVANRAELKTLLENRIEKADPV